MNTIQIPVDDRIKSRFRLISAYSSFKLVFPYILAVIMLISAVDWGDGIWLVILTPWIPVAIFFGICIYYFNLFKPWAYIIIICFTLITFFLTFMGFLLLLENSGSNGTSIVNGGNFGSLVGFGAVAILDVITLISLINLRSFLFRIKDR